MSDEYTDAELQEYVDQYLLGVMYNTYAEIIHDYNIALASGFNPKKIGEICKAQIGVLNYILQRYNILERQGVEKFTNIDDLVKPNPDNPEQSKYEEALLNQKMEARKANAEANHKEETSEEEDKSTKDNVVSLDKFRK